MFESSFFEITPELERAAMAEVEAMKNRDVSRRWFTPAIKTVVQNERNLRFKDDVDKLLTNKIDNWTDNNNEYLTAVQTFAYSVGRLANPDTKVDKEDYIELLVARIIMLALETRADTLFGRNVDDFVE